MDLFSTGMPFISRIIFFLEKAAWDLFFPEEGLLKLIFFLGRPFEFYFFLGMASKLFFPCNILSHARGAGSP